MRQLPFNRQYGLDAGTKAPSTRPNCFAPMLPSAMVKFGSGGLIRCRWRPDRLQAATLRHSSGENKRSKAAIHRRRYTITMQSHTGRRIWFTAAAVLSTFAIPPSGNASGSPWVPTDNDIKELEGKIQMPKAAAPLSTFNREYEGRVEHGHRVIVGLYTGSGGRIVIYKSQGQLDDTTLDGGCGIINVKYDLTTHRVLHINCHVEA
jgi:hypothetical protein